VRVFFEGLRRGTGDLLAREAREVFLARAHAAEALAELARLAVHAKSETVRIAAIREVLDRAYGKPTQFLAADDDVVPANLSAAELRAEMVAQFQRAFPEYRLIKVIPAENRAGTRRRQTLRSGPNATLIGPAPDPKQTTPALTDDEQI
jgi:hypothetical protein